MIDTEQWRSVIGRFIARPKKIKISSKNQNKQKSNSQDWSDLCGRLFVLAITFWCFHAEQVLVSKVLTSSLPLNFDPVNQNATSSCCTNFDLLMLCGDTESNPGPDTPQTFEEKLDRFASNIMSSIEKVQTTVQEMKTQLCDIQETVSTLKNDLQSVSQRVKDVEENQELQRLDIDHCADKLDLLESRISDIEDKAEKQEQYSRRENIILHGVSEVSDENYETTRKRVTQIFNNTVKDKTWHENDIHRSHRLGNHNAKKPRPIIVRLVNFQDKLTILKARDDLQKCAIGVANDLTKNQRKELSKLREKKQKGYYKNGVLNVVPNDDNQARGKSGGAHDMPIPKS